MSVNKLILIGNLGKDPRKINTNSGTPMVSFTVATHESVNRNGTWEEETEWHDIVVFGNTATTCLNNLSKGRKVYVEGRLRTRKYTKDGVEFKTKEVVATKVDFLDSKNKSNNTGFPEPDLSNKEGVVEKVSSARSTTNLSNSLATMVEETQS